MSGFRTTKMYRTDLRQELTFQQKSSYYINGRKRKGKWEWWNLNMADYFRSVNLNRSPRQVHLVKSSETRNLDTKRLLNRWCCVLILKTKETRDQMTG